jgi:hypothetical protein
MKRCILLFAVMSLCGPAFSQSILLGEIVSDDRSIRDPMYNLSSRYPAGWMVRGVTRWGDRETTIFFGPPSATAFSTLYYRIYASPTTVPADAEAFLREEARRKEEQRITGGLADYANVVNSFGFKQVAGHPALSYSARFTGGGTTQPSVLGERWKLKGMPSMRSPSALITPRYRRGPSMKVKTPSLNFAAVTTRGCGLLSIK